MLKIPYAFVKRWWHCFWNVLLLRRASDGHAHCGTETWIGWTVIVIGCTCGCVFYKKDNNHA